MKVCDTFSNYWEGLKNFVVRYQVLNILSLCVVIVLGISVKNIWFILFTWDPRKYGHQLEFVIFNMTIGLTLPERILLRARCPRVIINSTILLSYCLTQIINYMVIINHMRLGTWDSGEAKLTSESVEFLIPFQSHLVKLLKINWSKNT